MTRLTTDSLPADAARRLREIRKRYTVGFDPFSVRGHEIQLLKILDLEQVLKGRDPFANVSEFPFWIRVWEAAMILADVAATLPAAPGHRLLELGAGLGAPGLIAAARGLNVTLSDFDELILDFQRVSAAASGLGTVSFSFIDWTKPPALAPFDTIIGAEIIFREDLLDPLLHVIDTLLAPGGTVYLAHDQGRKSLALFLDKAQKSYTIMGKKVELDSGDGKKTIILNRLQRK